MDCKALSVVPWFLPQSTAPGQLSEFNHNPCSASKTTLEMTMIHWRQMRVFCLKKRKKKKRKTRQKNNNDTIRRGRLIFQEPLIHRSQWIEASLLAQVFLSFFFFTPDIMSSWWRVVCSILQRHLRCIINNRNQSFEIATEDTQVSLNPSNAYGWLLVL